MSHIHPIYQDDPSHAMNSLIVRELCAMVEAAERGRQAIAEQDALDAEVLTGKCEFIIEHWNERDAYVCGQEALTFCAQCGFEICLKHAVKIQMETYCTPCGMNRQ